MRRPFVSFAISLGLALSAPALGAVAGGTPAACAATDQRAALVVDTGARTFSFCVAMDDAGVSGLDLIRLANDQFGLDYRLGFGGRAVCRLASVGVDGDDCFGAFPDFWGYWRGDGGGGWTWSSTGAADTTVEPGDVEGWSWGSGQDGSTHPKPPATQVEEVCPPVSPSPSPPPGDDGGDGEGSGGGHGSPANGDGAKPGTDRTASPSASPSRADRGSADRVRVSATPSAAADPTPSASDAAAITQASGVGGPGGGDGTAAGSLLAVAAIALLGAGGAALIRRRRART